MRSSPRRSPSMRFNSRLREEATVVADVPQDVGEVSTHASVRRRQVHVPPGMAFGVSTHASVRRRRTHAARRALPPGFNSRLREEATPPGGPCRCSGRVSTHASVRRRPALSQGHLPTFAVSTHASVRRRPASARRQRGKLRSFNSRLREEATSISEATAWKVEKFQLTPP